MSNAIVGARTVTDLPSYTYLDAGGDYVVVIVSFGHEVQESGQGGEMRMVEIYTVRNGKIASLDPYYEDTVPFAIASGVVKAE
jgi:ketosteroid isomerase-like protein